MTKQWILSALALSLFATAALADDGGMGRKGHKGERVDFATMDANGDGQITADEIEARKAAKFAELDTDGDGEVSLEEFTAHHEGRGGDRAEKMIKLLDADGSGGLSQEELENRKNISRSQAMIAFLDENGDGQISEEEFNNAKGHHGMRGWK